MRQTPPIIMRFVQKRINCLVVFALHTSSPESTVELILHGHSIPRRQQLFKRLITLSTGQITIHWITQLVSLILIRWIVIYPVDSSIQSLNNRGELPESGRTKMSVSHYRIWLVLQADKMKWIQFSDWLPKRSGRTYLACSELSVT